MANKLETRAGLQPATQNEIPFSITTQQAEEFIQRKFDVIVNAMNKDGGHQEDVNVMLITTETSKKFMPFIIILPTSVLREGKKKTNDNEPDIFNPESVSKVTPLKDPFYRLIASYTFNKDDEHAFFSTQMRRELGISLKSAHEIKANRMPKTTRINKSRNDYVTCLLDPLRVFHDMLTNPGEKNEKFYINIGNKERIKGANFRYQVSRVRKSNKGNNQHGSDRERIIREISQRIHG